MKNHRNGYSLVELLVVMAIMSAIIGVSTLGLFNMRRKSDLDRARSQIVSILGEARNRAVSQDEGEAWSVRFMNNAPQTSYYAIFYGIYATSAERGKYSLPDNVQYISSTIPIGSFKDVSFAELTGRATSTVVSIILGIHPFISSTITISSSGIISY